MLDTIISTIGAASIIGAAAWLARTWLKERLTASLRLETQQKMEKLRVALESANQRIRDLTSVGAAANSQVESALLAHRISAVKEVWAAMLSWQQVSAATMMVSVLTDDWIKENASDPRTRSTFEQLLKDADYREFMKRQSATELVRPFLSETGWALYSAYRSFLSAQLMKAVLMTMPGINHAEMFTRSKERELVEKSAPAEILAAYDQSPYAATEPYLSFLREALLTEFRQFLSGSRAGSQAVQDAAEILRSAENLATWASDSSKNLENRQDS